MDRGAVAFTENDKTPANSILQYCPIDKGCPESRDWARDLLAVLVLHSTAVAAIRISASLHSP